MNFTNDELLALTNYFNTTEDLPQVIEVINARLRDFAATQAGVPTVADTAVDEVPEMVAVPVEDVPSTPVEEQPLVNAGDTVDTTANPT